MDVEDLTSLVLTKFINKISDETKTLENPHGYLWRIARNALVDFIGQKDKFPDTVSINENIDGIPNEADGYRSEHFKQKTEELMKCVKRNLKPKEAEIVELCVMYDQKAPEIASALNLKPDNIRQKLSRSLKKLRKTCIDIWQKHNN